MEISLSCLFGRTNYKSFSICFNVSTAWYDNLFELLIIKMSVDTLIKFFFFWIDIVMDGDAQHGYGHGRTLLLIFFLTANKMVSNRLS